MQQQPRQTLQTRKRASAALSTPTPAPLLPGGQPRHSHHKPLTQYGREEYGNSVQHIIFAARHGAPNTQTRVTLHCAHSTAHSLIGRKGLAKKGGEKPGLLMMAKHQERHSTTAVIEGLLQRDPHGTGGGGWRSVLLQHAQCSMLVHRQSVQKTRVCAVFATQATLGHGHIPLPTTCCL